MNLKETFLTIIKKGLNETNNIAQPEARANCYAMLASAIAQSGLLIADNSTSTSFDKEDLTDKAAKKEIKEEESINEQEVLEDQEVQETDEVEVSESKEAPVPNNTEKMSAMPKEESEDDDDDGTKWTEANKEKYKEELAYIRELKEEYEDDSIIACITNYFNDNTGQEHGFEDITPNNIEGFVVYMQSILAQQE